MAWADVEINETNFPDEKFRSYLLSQSYGKDGVLTDAEIASITKINVSHKDIQSLRGIEFFTALEELWCFRNQLTTLDVSKNKALQLLFCNDNQMTTLDVSGCTALKTLCCGVNQLTTLDVSGCTWLTTLDCYDNLLTTLNVSNNTALEELFCFQNQIKGAGMDALIENLPTLRRGMIFVIYDEEECNEMTTTQVAAAKAKGWIPLFFDGIEYTGSVPDGIDSPKFSPEGKDTIYNLGGQRIGGMAKGLNIVDGRKVWVK